MRKDVVFLNTGCMICLMFFGEFLCWRRVNCKGGVMQYLLFYIVCNMEGCIWVYWSLKTPEMIKVEYGNCGIPLVLEKSTAI